MGFCRCRKSINSFRVSPNRKIFEMLETPAMLFSTEEKTGGRDKDVLRSKDDG